MVTRAAVNRFRLKVRILPVEPNTGLTQRPECLPFKQDVMGSNPIAGTNLIIKYASITLESMCLAENEENSVRLGVEAPLIDSLKVKPPSDKR
jgi:hypothetical protein